MSTHRRTARDDAITSLIGMVLALTLLIGAVASVALLLSRSASTEGDEYVQAQDQLAERTLEAMLTSAGEPSNWDEQASPPTRVGFQVSNENGTGDLAKLAAVRDRIERPFGTCAKGGSDCIKWKCLPADTGCNEQQTWTGRMGLAEKNVQLTARPVANDAVTLPPTPMMYAAAYDDTNGDGKPDGFSKAGNAEAGAFDRTNSGFTNRTNTWSWNWTVGIGTDATPKAATTYKAHWRDIQEKLIMYSAGVRITDVNVDDADYNTYYSNGWKLVSFADGLAPNPGGGSNDAPEGDFLAGATYFDTGAAGGGQWESWGEMGAVMVLEPVNLYGEGSAFLTFTQYIDTKNNPAKSAYGRVWAREAGTSGAWTHLATYEDANGGWAVVDDESFSSGLNDGCYGGTPGDGYAPADLSDFLGKRTEIALEWLNPSATPGGDKDIRGWFIDNIKIGLVREESGTCDPGTDIIYFNGFEPDPDRVPNIVFGSGADVGGLFTKTEGGDTIDLHYLTAPLAALIEGGTNIVIMGQDADPGDWLETYGLGASPWTGEPTVVPDHQVNVFPNNVDLADASNYAAYGWLDVGAAAWDTAVNTTGPAAHSLWVQVTPPQPGAGTIIATALKPGSKAAGGGSTGKQLADDLVENTLGAFYFSSMVFDVGQPLPEFPTQEVGTAMRTLTFPVFEQGGPRAGVRFTMHVWD